MTDDRGQQDIRNTLRRGAPARAGRVGDPNVLSDAAEPNQLSSQAAGSMTQAPANQPLTPRPTVVSQSAASAPTTPFGRAAEPRRRGMPSVSILIFMAFAALTVFRFIGQVADGNDPGTDPTTGPVIGNPQPGAISFGTKQSDECEIVDEAATFTAGSHVQWVAVLAESQAPDAGVVVLFFRNGIRSGREDVPADPSVGEWDTLCSGDPVADSSVGRYRLEIWDEEFTVLLARGDYQVTPAP